MKICVLGYDAPVARKKISSPAPPTLPILIAAAGFFLAQVAFVAGAASPFRLPKEATALTFLCLAVGLAALSAAKRGAVVLPRGRLTLVLLALPAVQIASLLWSASPRRSLEAALLTLIWVVGTLWMATVEDKSRKKIGTAAAVGVAVSVIVMFAQLAGVSVFNFAARFASSRLSLTGLTGNPADLAMASVLMLPFLLTWADSSSHPWFHRSLIVLFSLATLISQTLTGIAALCAVLLVWLVQQRSRKMWIAAAGIGVLAMAIALGAGLGKRLEKEAGRVRAGNWYSLLSARGDGWTAAEEMIRSNPLGGVGAAAYTHQYYPNRLAWLTRNGGTGGRDELASHFKWAHCDPLQVVAELGLPGLLWMAALGWAVFTAGRRSGPFLPLTVAAFAPFTLLHYPTHLAVGLIPISLSLAHVMARAAPPTEFTWRRGRVPVAAVVVVLAGLGIFWQLQRVAVDVWMGGLEIRLALSSEANSETRRRLGAAVEAQALPRVERLGVQSSALWRTVGRARLLRGDPRGAETAFRTAYAGWPHEDAEFYLGVESGRPRAPDRRARPPRPRLPYEPQTGGPHWRHRPATSGAGHPRDLRIVVIREVTPGLVRIPNLQRDLGKMRLGDEKMALRGGGPEGRRSKEELPRFPPLCRTRNGSYRKGQFRDAFAARRFSQASRLK